MCRAVKAAPNRRQDAKIFDSIVRVTDWVERNDYNGLRYLRWLERAVSTPLSLQQQSCLQVLQQGVRRFPINLRPVLGIARAFRAKAWDFWRAGFMRLHDTTGDPSGRDKAEFTLQWLTENQSPGYSGACWGNHFDYQSRAFYLPKGVPTVVWTSLIGHAFLDGYDHFKNDTVSEYRSQRLRTHPAGPGDISPIGDGLCISYIPAHEQAGA